ncbi:hypothetical protein RZA67_10490 [Stenotrophomonas sp. C3(2023)]|uniref:hypothetical protein n=1 Tax=Stenotrophomonas sp. C3(2023) TaxID=3080277 RepID=UPI00293C9208|nr:hypothetical protein [Stenotrophomonas sp. C3(2023)]MDV3469149.1 hypothetical protein [Stenotrophomonas sp. C3(2023)]
MDHPAAPAAALAPAPIAANELDAVLQAPDLATAERAYLGLLPDRAHVDALARQAATLARHGPGTRYALSLTLVGMRLQEFKMGDACAAQCRHDSLHGLRQAFAAG